MSDYDFLQRQGHAGLSSRVLLVLLIFITAVMTLPALGLAPFSTKGEPREAIVAMQMLESGDWILPPDINGDIPYKPPMLYWAMALSTHLPVYSPEFAFRLPSALALLGLVCLTFWFVNAFAPSRQNVSRPFRAFLTAIVFLTSSEIIRAGVNARVDMVNTFFMVAAMMSFFRWFHRNSLLSAASAVLCMSAAVLTKGPVGILLPGFIGLVFAIRSGHRFRGAVLKIGIACCIACILPAIWYYEAYQRGGQAFLDLVYDENLGRFLGRMSYSSHEKGIWYYFAMLPAGWLPWSLLALYSLFSLKKTGASSKSNIKERLARLSSADFFALSAAVIIFIFYSIPKSKRGVYLLPMYPFVAYFLTDWIIILTARGKRSPIAYYYTIAIISLIAGLGMLIAPWLPIKANILPLPGFGILPLFASAIAFFALSRRKKDVTAPLVGSCLAIIVLYMTFFIYINPLIAEAKSDKHRAEAISAVVPADTPIYAHNPSRLDRWYSITYYLYGRIIPILRSANYSSYDAPYDTPDETPKVDSLLSAQGGCIFYLTSASQRGSETLNRIAHVADTAVVYESKSRSADLKERPIVYRLTRRQQ